MSVCVSECDVYLRLCVSTLACTQGVYVYVCVCLCDCVYVFGRMCVCEMKETENKRREDHMPPASTDIASNGHLRFNKQLTYDALSLTLHDTTDARPFVA